MLQWFHLQSPYDGRDDVWALRCVFLELLSKRRVHGSNGWNVHLSSTHYEDITRKQEILHLIQQTHPYLGQAVAMMLSDTAQRPTAVEMQRQLDALIDEEKHAHEQQQEQMMMRHLLQKEESISNMKVGGSALLHEVCEVALCADALSHHNLPA